MYLGSNGFPYGMAAIQRQLQVARAIQNNTTDVIVVNHKGPHTAHIAASENIGVKGSFEGIRYLYTSGTPRYPNNYFVRNFLKIIGRLGEVFILFYYRLFKNLSCTIVNTTSLTKLKYYYFITKMAGTTLIYDYVEYMSSLSDRTRKAAGDGKTFDTEFHNYADALLIISKFLEEHVQKIAPGIPYLVVPPIIDFGKFNRNTSKPPETNYFLFCGSTHYRDVIDFILTAYRKANVRNQDIPLILVINGSADYIANLRNSCASDERISVRTALPYEVLIGYYKHAKALLIPLQDNLQDKARFPFKICEYTAAARPIVTSDYGALSGYFQDGVNALLARAGDVDDFAAKLDFIANNPEQAEQLARQGHEVGLRNFNYNAYSADLHKLISEIS